MSKPSHPEDPSVTITAHPRLSLRERLDAAAKRRGVKRSAAIELAVVGWLLQEGA